MKNSTPQQRFDDAFAMMDYLLARVDTPNKPEMIEKLNELITPHILVSENGVKDAQIIEDSKINHIPIFVLTAKDFNSVPTLYDYQTTCGLSGCTQKHMDGIIKRIDDFELWQSENKSKVKLPD
ncbi:MAG: hypothetical protein QM503_04660 [Bacteroidota bacterium]